jgi:hypothetical protein
METANQKFAKRLRAAMEKAGYEPKPAVLEREFNLRYWGKPMTLHGVRRWLLGESMPKQDKLETLAEWLIVTPQHLRFGEEIGKRIDKRRARWEEAIGYREREAFELSSTCPPPAQDRQGSDLRLLPGRCPSRRKAPAAAKTATTTRRRTRT